MPGTIQPHGALLALDPSRNLTIVAASTNVEAYLPGFAPGGSVPVGDRLANKVGRRFREDIENLLTAGELRSDAPWEMSVRIPETDAALEATVHLHAGLLLVEFEHVTFLGQEQALAATRVLQRCIAKLRRTTGNLENLATVVVQAIRQLSGYERVVIYRFGPDWNGQAIAEDRVDDWDQSLNGIPFSASNIPAQARELYRRSHMRWMPDRDAVPVALLLDPAWPGVGPGGPAIDLSFARLRSFSPIHLGIHRALGIDGSMSLSLIQDDELWGLVVCHHRQPHYPSAGQRADALALADAFSVRVGPAERAGAEQDRQADAQRLGELLAHMAAAEDVGSALTQGPVSIGSLFNATGAAVLYEHQVLLVGATPPEEAVLDLARWLGGRTDEMFQTDHIMAHQPDWAAYAGFASGVLAVFLSADRSEMLLWFRGEEAGSVTWAGNSGEPAKDPTAAGPQQVFKRWKGERHGFARPWADWEVEIAETLRHALTEVIIRSLRRISDLNEQLRQSQKMEAVGQLTGGLAHDLNNMLQAIGGNLEMIQRRAEQGRSNETGRFASAAHKTVERAAALIHSLLAFARRQSLQPRPVEPDALISGMEDLVRRTMGPAIAVQSRLANGVWAVMCDPNQLEIVLMNLALNARDAMPHGGRLTLATRDARLAAADVAGHGGARPGAYVEIAVTDTGMGMDGATKSRAFEPFFTTKPFGQGTGLGLSQLHGFVQQSGGIVRLESAPGQGTTVRVFLPRHAQSGGSDLNEPAAGSASSGPLDEAKTVLLVEDELAVRLVAAEVLRDLGYLVFEAADGPDALRQLSSKIRVNLLVTDVGLPGGLNGRQLADAARERRPGLPVLFTTGYAGSILEGELAPGMEVIGKPFTLDLFAAQVTAMLEAAGSH